MSWTALVKVELPFLDEEFDEEGNRIKTGRTKEPGKKITKQEFNDAGQTDDDIAALVRDGAIKED